MRSRAGDDDYPTRSAGATLPSPCETPRMMFCYSTPGVCHRVEEFDAHSNVQATQLVVWSSPTLLAVWFRYMNGRYVLSSDCCSPLPIYLHRTLWRIMSSVSGLARMAPTPLLSANTYTTLWAVTGTCLETIPPVLSTPARETAARYAILVFSLHDSC